jgi:23S rRNA (pseudouridine1915-N3)-methyltransferase
MKFSEAEQQTWSELQPYVDTCLLPVTGLTGTEQPWEAAEALERLRDALDCFEIPYKGRVMTYPAFHFTPDGADGTVEFLNGICKGLRAGGFRHILLISAKPELAPLLETVEADLAFTLPEELLSQSLPEVKQQVAEKLQHLWANPANTAQ